MRNIFYIFRRDIKRLAKNLVAVVVSIGVCFVPALYAWFNIAANMDPYSNTGGIHIAVANCDKGTENEAIGSLNAGDKIIEALEANDSLGWVFLDEDEAIGGVRAGDYYAALVIPETFSEDLASVLSGDIESPAIEYYVNEKKNAIAPKVTDTGATTIQQQIDETFLSVASEAVAEVVKQAAQDATGDISQLDDEATGKVDKIAKKVADARKSLSEHARTDEQNAAAIAQGQDAVTSTEKAADSASKTLRLTNQALAIKLADMLDGLDPSFAKMHTLLTQTEESLNRANDVMEQTDDLLGNAEKEIGKISDDISVLKSASIYSALSEIGYGDALDSDKISSFISSPVDVKTVSLYPVKNYGTAMTPFYTNLALWVSGIVLVSVLKMEVDEDERLKKLTPTQGYFGRWLTYMLFAFVQAVIICAGDILIFDVQCENVPAFFGAALLASFVYVNIIYALAITFKHTGKAICVLLVILQIPGSAGTYPIEMTPGFFQALHPLLPFTYGINAMREAMVGMYENYYAKYLLCLAIFLVPAFVIGLLVRPLMLNLNRMFDRKLEETGLMICEETGMTVERVKLSTLLEILSGQDEFRERMETSAAKFEKNFEKLKFAGIALIILLPLVFLVLMFNVNSKMVFLILWISSIVAVVLYLIIIEFIHDNMQRKLRFAGKSREEILGSMNGKGLISELREKVRASILPGEKEGEADGR